jgi:hypothetical protein
MRFGKDLRYWLAALVLFCFTPLFMHFASFESRAHAADTEPNPQETLLAQSQEQVDAKNAGCVSCHTVTDRSTMHPTKTVRLACIDCHGGNAEVVRRADDAPASPAYEELKRRAHPRSRIFPAGSPANRVRAYARWLQESEEYVQFVNPGDLRAAPKTCGQESGTLPGKKTIPF